jgi:SAM-dependent methyltransferase
MGSGENVPYYSADQVEIIYGLEPSEGMRVLAQPTIQESGLPIELLDASGESVPLPDQSIDTVLLTYTLCTISDRAAALREIKRVLKPEGRLIFCEHALAPDARVVRWQHRLNDLWSFFAGGCHINVAIVDLIRDAGFHIELLDEMYVPGTPRIMGYNVWGEASIQAD